MELNPLTRPQDDYLRAMVEWAACPTLSSNEKNLVDNLVAAAAKSKEDFDAMRRVALSGSFFLIFLTAVAKARAAGINKEWPQ